jgi:hypothetical protein
VGERIERVRIQASRRGGGADPPDRRRRRRGSVIQEKHRSERRRRLPDATGHGLGRHVYASRGPDTDGHRVGNWRHPFDHERPRIREHVKRRQVHGPELVAQVTKPVMQQRPGQR